VSSVTSWWSSAQPNGGTDAADTSAARAQGRARVTRSSSRTVQDL
jgi:hypothetical protein